MSMKNILILFFLVGSIYFLESCNMAGGNYPGREYMPDMAHSIAYEANYYNYYRNNTWGTEQEYKTFASPGLPVKGTMPRGYAGYALEGDIAGKADLSNAMKGVSSKNGISIPFNGHVPYYYDDTEEERLRATAEITQNPFPITADGLARGKELYTINCAICHGDKGDGAGYLVRDDGGVYPAQPANFLQDEFINSSEGRYYHSIMYGKNVMGGYSDKLSYEERWQVIHYVRSLQAKEKKLEYTPESNTLNTSAVTEKEWNEKYASVISEMDNAEEEMNGGEAHSDEGETNNHQHEGGHH